MALMYRNKTNINGRLRKPDIDFIREADIVYSKPSSPLTKAYERVNPAKDILDKAMMEKYPDVDFDTLKKGATEVPNTGMEEYLAQNKKYLDYYLTPEEMKGALEGTGYEDFVRNAKAIRHTAGVGGTAGTKELDDDYKKERYGMRHMLYKYSTPRVEGKLMPYRFKKDLYE